MDSKNTKAVTDRMIQAVLTDRCHDLRLGLRRTIYRTLVSSRTGLPSSRIVVLAIRSIEKVVHCWNRIVPSDVAFSDAHDLLCAKLAGEAVSGACERSANELWAHCDDLLIRFQEDQNGIMVGYALAQALRLSIGHDLLKVSDYREELTDANSDPYDQDPFYFAATAFANGAPWDPLSDPLARLRYWKWWLTEAIPSLD